MRRQGGDFEAVGCGYTDERWGLRADVAESVRGAAPPCCPPHRQLLLSGQAAGRQAANRLQRPAVGAVHVHLACQSPHNRRNHPLS